MSALVYRQRWWTIIARHQHNHGLHFRLALMCLTIIYKCFTVLYLYTAKRFNIVAHKHVTDVYQLARGAGQARGNTNTVKDHINLSKFLQDFTEWVSEAATRLTANAKEIKSRADMPNCWRHDTHNVQTVRSLSDQLYGRQTKMMIDTRRLCMAHPRKKE